MGKELVATKSFRYGGKKLVAGDSFTANRRDERVLTAIGSATYSTRVLTADTDEVPVKPVVPRVAKEKPAKKPATKTVAKTKAVAKTKSGKKAK